MAWITVERVEALLQTSLNGDQYILELIDHVQGLAEVEIGEQAEPSAGLKSVFSEIVAHKWQVGQSAQANPAGFQHQAVGPFAFQDPSARTAGLGLTNREKAALRKAAGINPGLWIQPLSRGDVLEIGETDERLWEPLP